MEKLEKLLADLTAVDEKIDTLLAVDELSDAQRTEHERLTAERKRIVAGVQRERDRASREEERARLADDAERAGRIRPSTAPTVPAEPRRPDRERALTTPDTPTPLGPGQRPARTDADGRVTSFYEDTDEAINLRVGESADAVRRHSYRENRRQNRRTLQAAGYVPWNPSTFPTFAHFVREGLAGTGHPRFEDKVHRHFAAVQGMSEGIGSDGGYTVMPEFNDGIIDRVYANELWSRTDNYTVMGNNLTFLANAETSRASGSRAGGLRGYWMAEGGSITATKPTLREVSLKLVKLGVLVYLTQELIDDGGGALQAYVARKASEEFNFLIGDSLVNGTGAGQPLGILNAPSLVSVAKEVGQGAATLQTENFAKMFARFFMPNYKNALWLHNQDVASQLMTLTLGIGTAGVTTYMPPGSFSAMPYGTMLGRPLQPTEFNQTLGTQGDVIVADLGQILSISKGGIAQAVSIHVQFLTQQVALLFTMRLNARPWMTAPLTPFRGTATQSDFVVLDTRS